MATFLLKTEPSVYSYLDLMRDKTTTWDGVANPAALLALRTMRKGDQAFIYHTGTERSIVGLASVITDAYGQPKFAVVDLKAKKAAKNPVSLEMMKNDKRFVGFELL